MKPSLGFCIVALVVAGACHPVPPPAASAQEYSGLYVLQTVDSQPLPYVRPGVVPGEGMALRSATVEFTSPDSYRAQVIAAFTDSGTVTDTLSASGTWSRRGAYLVLASEWAPWRLSPRVRSDTLTGWVQADGFILPHFSIFTSRFFGHGVELRFTRQR